MASVDKSIQLAFPEVPWSEAVALRNLLIHEYFRIEYDEVWKTLMQDLPVLKAQINNILNKIKI